MDIRRAELSDLKKYTDAVDKELTMILQSLQWDRSSLLQKPALIRCKYDSNHRMPPAHCAGHEQQCFLTHHGYRDEDLLPDPLDPTSSTLVKLSKEDVAKILANASRINASIKTGVGSMGPEPLSLERLQCVYSGDERRALHDAVVSAVPSCHDLADLALISSTEQGSGQVKPASRAEVLAELRNMRRRRTKYRVAAKSRNYSDVLRDVIKTQMEHYNEAKTSLEVEPIPTTTNGKQTSADQARSKLIDRSHEQHRQGHRDDVRERQGTHDKHEQYREKSGRDYDSHSKERNMSNRDYDRHSSGRHEKHRDRDTRHSRDRKYKNYNEREIKVEKDDDPERKNYRESKDSDKYREYSRKRRHDNHGRDERGNHPAHDARVKQEYPSDHRDDARQEKRKYDERRSYDSYKRSKDSKYDKSLEKQKHCKDRKERTYHDDKERRSKKEYFNIRVKSERVSREQSYESYTTEDTCADKYSRYTDTTQQ